MATHTEAHKTSVQPIVKPEESGVCHFLRVPAEIRLAIYRYLLLPETDIVLGEIAHRRNYHKREEEEADEDGWVDEDSTDSEIWSTDGSSHGCICGMCDTHDSEFDGDTDTESDMSLSSVEHPRIHSQILRVNHQVYQESSSVLYSEATFVLDPEDILCLSKTKVRPYGAAPFEHFDPPLNKLWRYDPRKGVGRRNRKGDIVYKTPKSEGVLDPHVFARFRKIKFDSYLDQDHMSPEECLWIDDTSLTLNKIQVADYQAAMERLPIYKDLVRILAHSKHITELSITLEADVVASSNAIERADDAGSDDEEEDWAELESRAEKSQEAANERATEALFDSKMFDPLLKLSNVQNFHFSFSFLHRAEKEEVYKPSAAHTRKIISMKEVIEGKFKERNPS